MMGMGSPSIKPYPPQGSVGASERALLLDLYSGIPLLEFIVVFIDENWDNVTPTLSTLVIDTSIETLIITN